MATTKSGKTALSSAVSAGNLKAAEILLRNNPKLLHLTDSGGSSALMWASENANVTKNGPNMVELLLRHGASVSAIDAKGLTALDRLCMTCGNVRAALILIKCGAAIRTEPTQKQQMTTLMLAAMNGHKELVRELLEKHGVDPRIRNSRGFDAQIYAESSGHVLVGKIIEEKKIERQAAMDK